MNKSITGAMLGLLVFLAGYCICFWFGIMPKFYPHTGEIHITPPPGIQIAVKFVGSAVVGIVAGLIALLIGRKLPQKSSLIIHVLTWAVMIAACVYLIGRETREYILR